MTRRTVRKALSAASGHGVGARLLPLPLSLTLAMSVSLLSPGAAEAGRGGSPEKILSAIRSNSADAIASELERSEYLVCGACVDYVLPLVDHQDPRVRQVAAWWLARRGAGRAAFAGMLARLGQPDSVKARNAADYLGEIATPRAVPALAAALSNPLFHTDARVAMARALGAIAAVSKVAEAETALTGALAADQAPIRAAAVVALRRARGFAAPDRVTPLLADGDERVRFEAAVTLATIRARAAAPALVRVLESDPSANVRKHAAWALGEIGAPYGVAGAALGEAARNDESPLVRSLANAALSRLTR